MDAARPPRRPRSPARGRRDHAQVPDRVRARAAGGYRRAGPDRGDHQLPGGGRTPAGQRPGSLRDGSRAGRRLALGSCWDACAANLPRTTAKCSTLQASTRTASAAKPIDFHVRLRARGRPARRGRRPARARGTDVSARRASRRRLRPGRDPLAVVPGGRSAVVSVQHAPGLKDPWAERSGRVPSRRQRPAPGPRSAACICLQSDLEFPRRTVQGKRGRERADGAGELQLPGGSGPDPGPDGPFALQQQGNLPARADLERLGRDRPAPPGIALPVRTPRRRRPAADPGQL